MYREIEVPLTCAVDTGLVLPEAQLRAVFRYDPKTGQIAGVDLNASCLLYIGDENPQRVPVSVIVMLLGGKFRGGRHQLHDDTLSYLDALAADDEREQRDDETLYGRAG